MIISESNETIQTVFDLAIEVEFKAAEIYQVFSEFFSYLPEICAFWQDLAEDEIGHGNALEQIRASLTQSQLSFPCDREFFEKAAKVHRSLSKVAIESIHNLDDAYNLAHELEFSEVNAVFQLLSTEFVPFEKRQQFVVAEIKKHQQKLLYFDGKFGNRQWRQGIHPR